MALPLQDDLMASFAQHWQPMRSRKVMLEAARTEAQRGQKNVRSVYFSIGFYWCTTCLFVFLFFVVV